MKVVWTALVDRTLMDLVAKNLTYKEAARIMTAEFGMPFTKNSCIGRSRRLRMPDVPKQEVTIYDLRDDRCKWIFGDINDRPPYLYCGEPTGEIGCSWCPIHVKRVFNKSTFGSAMTPHRDW